MVRYGAALSFLLCSIRTKGFVIPFRNDLRVAQIFKRTRRYVAAPSLFDATYDDSDENGIGSISLDDLFDDEDPYEEELARKERKEKVLREKLGKFTVSLPLVAQAPLGVSLCEVNDGRFSDSVLDIDTLRLQANPDSYANTADEAKAFETVDQSTLAKRLGPSFRGVVVSSVVRDGKGWEEGIRPGDVLVATSATLGEALWPKSTIDGVRSAVSSRKSLSKTIRFELQRVEEAMADEQYELSLKRPFGLQLEESEDGYVEVKGLTDEAPRLVKYAVQVGDRIVGVENMAGRMWPISTIDAIVSSCTTRLPGQAVTFRFARPPEIAEKLRTKRAMELSSTVTEESAVTDKISTVTSTRAGKSATATKSSISENELKSRCKSLLRRYMTESNKVLKEKYSVLAIVADRVLESLASKSATVDGETLSLLMSAYLSSGKPVKAMEVFEGVVGLPADGSSADVSTMIKIEEGGGKITPNADALNLYSGTSLLRAHALQRKLPAVRRVLAALEGRHNIVVDGMKVAKWPGTGSGGAIHPDTRCYNTALDAASRERGAEGLQMAREIFERLDDPDTPGRQPKKDLVSYNTMISTLTRQGQYNEAFAVFDSMKVKPDEFTYATLIKACVQNGDLKELLIDMKQRGVKPDVVIYNTMIKSLCDQNMWFEATKLVTEMEQSRISPNSMTYGLLMNSLLKANKPSTCLTLFETACADSRTAAVTENVQLYTTAIAATSALGDHERALELVSRMKVVGLKPNLKTLTALMNACLSSDKPGLASEVFRRLESPDGVARAKGIQALSEAGELDLAFETLTERVYGKQRMSGKQTMSSYNILIYSALSRRNFDVARTTLSHLLKKGLVPSNEMFRRMLEALNLVRGRKNVLIDPDPEAFDFLLFVFDSIRTRKLSCDGSFYASVIQCGSRCDGLRRKVASLMAVARSLTDVGSEISMLEEDGDRLAVITWVDLVQNYDKYKDRIGTEVMLPQVAVHVAKRNIKQVLFAEKAVSYRDVTSSTSISRK